MPRISIVALVALAVGCAMALGTSNGACRPIAVAAIAIAIPDIAFDVEIETSVCVRIPDRFVRVINRLVHMPQMRHVDRNRMRKRSQAGNEGKGKQNETIFHF